MGLQESVIGNHILFRKVVTLFKLKLLLTSFLYLACRSVKIAHWRLS